MTGTSARVEIVTRAERRRRWSEEQKLEMVRRTLVAGASVSAVARQHEIAPSQLYTWRKQALAGAMAGFVPVEVTSPSLPPPILALSSEAPRGGMMEVGLPNGCCVRVGPDVDGPALTRVLAAAVGVRP